MERTLRILGRIAVGLLILIAASALAGAGYQHWSLAQDARDFPPPGVMVDIGSHRLHLDCRGEGSATLILDAGGQLWSSSWRWIQQDLARDHRVCAYDRSGLGWSEVGDGVHDLHTASDELALLLERSGEHGPFVHVGHSLGGMIPRVHQQRHPGQLAAAVLIDSGEPPVLIEDFEAERDDPVGTCSTSCYLQIGFAAIGVTRLILGNLDLLDDPSYPADAVAEFRALAPRPEAIRAMLRIVHYLPRSAFQALDAGHPTDLPTLVLYSGEYGELVSEGETEEEMARWRGRYQEEWTASVTASPDGVGPVEIPGANHVTVIVSQEHALRVAEEIRRFVGERF